MFLLALTLIKLKFSTNHRNYIKPHLQFHKIWIKLVQTKYAEQELM